MTRRPFRTTALSTNTVADIATLWDAIDFKPVYQRQSDIWADAKKQLFIDSLINGYDVPKLYFHDLGWKDKGARKRYAIIDGKQRLEAIRGFRDGEFGLSADFEDIEHAEEDARRLAASGAGYAELARKHPGLKIRLDTAELPIVLVQTEDPEFIEEMFSRLNEAVPLNAPEKRNAIGGPLPRHIRRLAKHACFVDCVKFENARYKHLDLATKFMFIEHKAGLVDLKKRDLDRFVRDFKKNKWVKKAGKLYERSDLILDKMKDVFLQSDPLLVSVGMITIYYQLFRDAFDNKWLNDISRDRLQQFDTARGQNRERVKEAQELALEGKQPSPDAGEINDVLTQFERYVQSPNDATALKRRYQVLRHFVKTGEVPEPH